MSMVGQALVMIAARTIKGRTWAGDRILEQPVDPIDQMLRGDEKKGRPFIGVYFESSKSEPIGMETQRGMSELVLKLIAYIPPEVTIVENGVELRMQDSGAGLALNVIARQADAALHFGNETWVDLFKGFVPSVTGRRVRFILIELEGGLRIPAIECQYELNTVSEPEFGRELYGYWKKLDDALRAEGLEGAAVADMFTRMIKDPGDLTDWEQFQMTTGLRNEAFSASGLAPLAIDDSDAVDIEDITSDPDLTVGNVDPAP